MTWTQQAKDDFDKWAQTSIAIFKGWPEDDIDNWWKEWTIEAKKTDKLHFPTLEVWSRMPRESKEIIAGNAAALRDVAKIHGA